MVGREGNLRAGHMDGRETLVEYHQDVAGRGELGDFADLLAGEGQARRVVRRAEHDAPGLRRHRRQDRGEIVAVEGRVVIDRGHGQMAEFGQKGGHDVDGRAGDDHMAVLDRGERPVDRDAAAMGEEPVVGMNPVGAETVERRAQQPPVEHPARA